MATKTKTKNPDHAPAQREFMRLFGRYKAAQSAAASVNAKAKKLSAQIERLTQQLQEAQAEADIVLGNIDAAKSEMDWAREVAKATPEWIQD